MVNVNTGSSGSSAISNDYPAVEGLTAGTTKQVGTKEHLEPEKYLITGWDGLL